MDPFEGEMMSHETFDVAAHVKLLGPPALTSIHRAPPGVKLSRAGIVGGGQLNICAQSNMSSPGLHKRDYFDRFGKKENQTTYHAPIEPSNVIRIGPGRACFFAGTRVIIGILFIGMYVSASVMYER